ncbi:MAG: hypothetical protein LIO97_07095 [Tannerellaceae bacterium]|nr:hypothetical protein [Tannerellaceae bacterium]
MNLITSLLFPLETYAQIAGSQTSGLPTAEMLATPTLTTPADYEQLILNTIREISNCQVMYSQKGYYKIVLTITPGTNHTNLKSQVFTLYHRNRNLCEMLGEIEIIGEALRTTFPVPSASICFDRKEEPHSYPALTTPFYRLQNHLPDCYRIKNSYRSTIEADIYNQYQQKQLNTNKSNWTDIYLFSIICWLIPNNRPATPDFYLIYPYSRVPIPYRISKKKLLPVWLTRKKGEKPVEPRQIQGSPAFTLSGLTGYFVRRG